MPSMRIEQATLVPLHRNLDGRGSLTEVFRSEWLHDAGVVQWNAVQSDAGVVRGVHVHRRHHDYLVVLDGHADVWLRDIRRESASCNVVERVGLTGLASGGLFIPAGVAHGIVFRRPTWLLAGESHYWSVDDELRCRWDDPALGFGWDLDAPKLSAQDRDAGSFAELVVRYRSTVSEPASKGLAGSGAPASSADSTASR
jgi:dTDP-4-dehydrorhamnose 3,5-epimerase